MKKRETRPDIYWADHSALQSFCVLTSTSRTSPPKEGSQMIPDGSVLGNNVNTSNLKKLDSKEVPYQADGNLE